MTDIQIRVAEAIVLGMMRRVEVTPISVTHGSMYRVTIHLTGKDCAEPGHPYCIEEDGETPAAAAGKLFATLLQWYFDPTGDLFGATVRRVVAPAPTAQPSIPEDLLGVI